jgi:PTH1 family peptidyl-tRNA hydrolase
MVIYDDLDLPLGQLRVRPRGGSGGHRGVASIAEYAGGEFVRIRIGIGRPGAARDAADHVLEPFAAEELPSVNAAVERACDAVQCVLTRGTAAAMNAFNGAAAAGAPGPTTKE